LTGRGSGFTSRPLSCRLGGMWHGSRGFADDATFVEEEMSEEAKAAAEAEQKRKAAEERKLQARAFAENRGAHKREMHEMRKKLIADVSKSALEKQKAQEKDSEAARAAANARVEARKQRALKNIAHRETMTARARERRAVLKAEKNDRRLQRLEFLKEGASLRKRVLLYFSRTWVTEDELDDRIMLALKYPDMLN